MSPVSRRRHALTERLSRPVHSAARVLLSAALSHERVRESLLAPSATGEAHTGTFLSF